MNPVCATHDAPAPQSCQRCGDFLCLRCVKDPIFILCKDCFGQKHQAWVEKCEKAAPRHIAIMCLGHFLFFVPILFGLAIYLEIGELLLFALPAILSGVGLWELYRFLMKWTRLAKDHDVRVVKYSRAEQDWISSIESFIKLSEEDQSKQRDKFRDEETPTRKKWEQLLKDEVNRDIELRDVPPWLSLPFLTSGLLINWWLGFDTVPGVLMGIYFGQAFVRVCHHIYQSIKQHS
ncbi:MAG: hypothetical protein P1V97_06350 [Planctomycetota bacterium]|nr:hypothetical protein [Planctomycetota bacterium]